MESHDQPPQDVLLHHHADDTLGGIDGSSRVDSPSQNNGISRPDSRLRHGQSQSLDHGISSHSPRPEEAAAHQDEYHQRYTNTPPIPAAPAASISRPASGLSGAGAATNSSNNAPQQQQQYGGSEHGSRGGSGQSAEAAASNAAANGRNHVVIKVGMVGDAQIGKTSLMVKYVEGSWDEDYIQTLGVNFMEKTISIRNTEITFSIWDLGGQREFVNMLPLVCNDAVAILFMFDLTRKSTLNSIKEWYRQGRGFNKTAIPILVGTKYDHFVNFPREDQEEISNQARRFAKAMRAALIFSSTSHSINVQKLLEQMVSRMAAVLAKPDISAVTRRLYITISGSVARSTPHRFGPYLKTLAPFLFKALGEEELAEHLEAISDGDDLGQDFNDVREAALTALEAFLASCPAQMEAFTNETITATLRFLRYDPNSAVDDDDEEMDVDEEDDFEDEEDFDMGGEFDDDDDASWKVRRCAAKALYTFISTRGSGELLEKGVLYQRAGNVLVKRFEEREENVRLEIISCLALLVRKTGEDLYPGSAWNLDNPDDEAPSQAPINRKRRRQSSVAEPGAASPVLEKAPATGPRADLVRLTPSIVKASNKLLKGKVISTKQAIFSLFD
ncbi:hypothetical protein BN1723_017832, partial [Verticillium longisporum]